jgi:hypothetical protein
MRKGTGAAAAAATAASGYDSDEEVYAAARAAEAAAEKTGMQYDSDDNPIVGGSIYGAWPHRSTEGMQLHGGSSLNAANTGIGRPDEALMTLDTHTYHTYCGCTQLDDKKKKKVDELAPLDHSEVDYPEFNKVCDVI